MIDALWRGALWIGYRGLIAWAFLRRPHIRGAYVCVRLPGVGGGAARMLVLRNSYKAGTTLPSGGIKRRESPREAGARELFEEVGLRVDPDALIADTVITLVVAYRTDEAHFFRVELDADSAVDLRIDRREVVWAEFVDEAALGERDLAPHLAGYLAWRRDHAADSA